MSTTDEIELYDQIYSTAHLSHATRSALPCSGTEGQSHGQPVATDDVFAWLDPKLLDIDAPDTTSTGIGSFESLTTLDHSTASSDTEAVDFGALFHDRLADSSDTPGSDTSKHGTERATAAGDPQPRSLTQRVNVILANRSRTTK